MEIQTLEVTEQLHLRGHSVWLACPPSSRLASEAIAHHLRVLEFDISRLPRPGSIWKLARFIAREGIRIIHCQLSRDLSTVVPAADISGRAPKILLSKRVGSFLSKKDLFHRYTYSRVARVLAISDVINKNVRETTPVPREHVITLHDAIDTDRFSPERAHGEIVRREFGYTAANVVTGFLGRFSPGKGHEELLQAAAAIVPQRPHVRFLVAGEASAGEEKYEREIRRLCTSLGLDTSVAFAGFRRDVPDVLAAFDLFAFPSHAESFGVALIEAMAMERPAVSTNCDGVLDIVVEGETGLFVHPRNAPELAAGLLKLIDDPDLRMRFGRAARKRVCESFDRKRQMEKLEALYDEVLHERGAV